MICSAFGSHTRLRTELAGGGKGVLASGQIEVLLVTMKPTIAVVFWPN